MSSPPSSLTSLTLSVSKGSPPNVVTNEMDIPLSSVNMGSNSILIPPTSSIFSAFENASVGTSFNYSIKGSYANQNGSNVLITTPGAQPFVPPPPPPIVLDSNGVTIKYTGPALTSTITPAFYLANPRGTGMEWFAVVDDSFKQRITDYANTSSGNYAAAVATFTPPGQSSPVIFNNIVTTLMTNMRIIISASPNFNEPVGSWDVSNVTNMYGMFEGGQNFDQDISKWNTSKVTDMGRMFFSNYKFNQDISKWNTSEVTDMREMFFSSYKFNQDISKWNTSKVTNMSSMFRDASKFNQPINYDSTTESWNVSNVIDMNVMFIGAINFNYDISNWNVSKVTTMIYMFYSATNFNKDISNWNVSNVTSFAGFALYSGLIEQHIPPRFR